MKTECLDIGIIQSFLDGELRNAESAHVSSHIATCDSCALMLAQAEDESAIVFPTLAREFDTLVPTQRLWNRINESIAIEKQQASVWEKAHAFFAAVFGNPSISVAAGLLIVAGVFAMLITNRSPVETSPDEVAKAPVSSTTISPRVIETAPTSIVETATSHTPRFERASYNADSARPNIQPAVYNSSRALPTNASFMPGEESYVKTISRLTKTVEDEKVGVLSVSQRVAYERDMAVVDDAIKKMRKELKRNPKNESAKQVLYSSYQNKIDLLTSVAQKEELVASLN